MCFQEHEWNEKNKNLMWRALPQETNTGVKETAEKGSELE